jgi:hypothetical protein
MAHQITVDWVIDPDVPQPFVAGSGYNVYKEVLPGTFGATPINGATPVQALEFIDTNVVAGETATYYVTAVVNGKESAASQTATATVPLQVVTGVVATAV